VIRSLYRVNHRAGFKNYGCGSEHYLVCQLFFVFFTIYLVGHFTQESLFFKAYEPNEIARQVAQLPGWVAVWLGQAERSWLLGYDPTDLI
jgi:hypothetical protein